jgi:hypothetical protein
VEGLGRAEEGWQVGVGVGVGSGEVGWDDVAGTLGGAAVRVAGTLGGTDADGEPAVSVTWCATAAADRSVAVIPAANRPHTATTAHRRLARALRCVAMVSPRFGGPHRARGYGISGG